jgi:Short C-terminal domain
MNADRRRSYLAAAVIGLLLTMVCALPMATMIGSFVYIIAPQLPAAIVGPSICPPQTTPEGKVSGQRRITYQITCLTSTGERVNTSEPAVDRWFLVCGLASIPFIWPLWVYMLRQNHPTRPQYVRRRTATDRIAELDQLQQQGAITAEEYERKRREIIDDV